MAGTFMLDRMIPIGEHHFRRAVTEFAGYYHRERNHQGLGDDGGRRICRCSRPGGLLNGYERAA
jgi:hypothetical protein